MSGCRGSCVAGIGRALARARCFTSFSMTNRKERGALTRHSRGSRRPLPGQSGRGIERICPPCPQSRLGAQCALNFLTLLADSLGSVRFAHLMADSLARSAFGSASVFPPAYQKMGEELAEAARGVFQATCSVVARRAHAFALERETIL